VKEGFQGVADAERTTLVSHSRAVPLSGLGNSNLDLGRIPQAASRLRAPCVVWLEHVSYLGIQYTADFLDGLVSQLVEFLLFDFEILGGVTPLRMEETVVH
jgi:hypothetical protein